MPSFVDFVLLGIICTILICVAVGALLAFDKIYPQEDDDE